MADKNLLSGLVSSLTALGFLLLLTGCGAESASPTGGAEEPLLLFAAAGTARVVEAAVEVYESKTGRPVRVSLAASSTLARQISAGAKADLYISANRKWMDYLVEENLVESDAVRLLASTRLVLIAPRESPLELEIRKGMDLAAKIPGRLSLGDPEHVPVGMYSRAALESLGCWDSLQDRIVPATDVLSALRAVSMGQCETGIVYASEMHGNPNLRVVVVLPADSHPAILFSGATLKEARPGAGELLRFIADPENAHFWAERGFITLAKEGCVR